MFLIAAAHLNSQIPQLVHSEYLSVLLFKYTSWMFLPHKCIPLLLSHYSTCPTPLGPKIMAQFLSISMTKITAPCLQLFCSAKSTVNCLVNYAFYDQETKYFRQNHGAKLICEFCAKQGWHLDHAVVDEVSLDHYIIDTNVRSEQLEDKSSSSDWMHLRGLGPPFILTS